MQTGKRSFVIRKEIRGNKAKKVMNVSREKRKTRKESLVQWYV